MSKLHEHITPTIPESNGVKVTSDKTGARKSFYRLCIFYVVEGFRAAIPSGLFSLTDEEDISDLIVTHIEQSFVRDEIESIDVDAEKRDRTIPVDGIVVKAKKRKRFDFVFKSFERPIVREMFTAEAKILKATDNDLLKKYVSEKGMRKYIDCHYKQPGFMIGYIMQSKPSEIHSKLNEIIEKDTSYASSEKLELQESINGHNHFYKSEHPKIILEHLLLDLNG